MSGDDPQESPEPVKAEAAQPQAAPAEEPARKSVSNAAEEVVQNAGSQRRAAGVNRSVRDAQAVFGSGGTHIGRDATIGGDAISGDKIYYQHFTAAAKAVTTYRINPALVRSAREAYAKGAHYSELIRFSAQRRLVIIQAPRGHGKTTAALHLLARAGHQQMLRYDPTVAPADIVDSLVDGTGYLIDEMADVGTRQLTARAIEDLEARLEASHTRLIIAVGDGVTFIDPSVHRFVLQLGPPAPLADVLTAHLLHRFGPSEYARVAAEPLLLELFEKEIRPDATRMEVAEFARHVFELTRRGTFDAESLRLRLHHGVAREVEGWFAGLSGTQLKCLAIALALLDGLPYELVSASADALWYRLDPPPPVDSLTVPPRDRFADNRTSRIAQLRASLSPKQVDSRFGELPAELVSYQDPAYPAQVLRLVWREYDDVRDDLLGWLRDLGNHWSETTRIRAASAAGFISLGAFEQIYRSVLERWALSSSDRMREAAGYALREPARTTALKSQVLALVDGWATSESEALKETAARAYGAAVGTLMPDLALRELDRLATTDDGGIALAVSLSLAELVDADHMCVQPVLEQILRWGADGRGGRSATAELAFLVLASDLVHSVGEPDAGGTEWPLLLYLAAKDSVLRALVASGWRGAINGRRVHAVAAKMLGLWAEGAEPHAEVRSALTLLLATVAAGHSRSTRTVSYLSRGWQTGRDGQTAPKTAAEVLAALPSGEAHGTESASTTAPAG